MSSKRQIASSAKLIALNSMWARACISAARPSIVRILRLGKSSGATNSGLVGRPGISLFGVRFVVERFSMPCKAHGYWLAGQVFWCCLFLCSYKAKTPSTFVLASASHSQSNAAWRISFICMFKRYLSSIKSNSPAFISGTIKYFSSLLSAISAAAL